jgi:hypothetical protein
MSVFLPLAIKVGYQGKAGSHEANRRQSPAIDARRQHRRTEPLKPCAKAQDRFCGRIE